jgi:pimeloyl-ACP methyl ester carboxylesterase
VGERANAAEEGKLGMSAPELMEVAGASDSYAEVNGVRLHYVEAGEGPLVVLLHGFPEFWYSWRNQIPALADAGYRVVAPDMRGYNLSDRPAGWQAYDAEHLAGDIAALIRHLGVEKAHVVGHDWGAAVAWQAARLRPDRFRAVAALSVPYRPRSEARPTSVMPRTADAQFYQLYFQAPGVAEAELERDPRATVRTMLYGASGEGAAAIRAATASGATAANLSMVPNDGGFLRGAGAPATLPAWLSEADIDFYAGEFKRSGFRGPLNYYRNVDRNWELMAAFAGVPVTVPALYVAGDRDMVVAFPGMDQLLANLKHFVPALRNIQMLPGCGHWTQQERPSEVNAAIIDFLRSLPN